MGWCVYNVSLIPQSGNRTCWYACAQMVVRWYRESRQQSTLEGWDVDTAARTTAERTLNRGLGPSAVYQFARAVNLRTTAMSVTADGMADLLGFRGPLWYGGDVRGYRGVNTGAHAVVIRGISGNTLYINDPWAPGVGLRHTMDHNTFFQQLRAIGTVPFLHI